MFGSAVFFAPAPHPDATYELDPVNRYVCRSGSWYREAYVETRERNSKLGAILRAVDQRLRNAIGYEHPLVEKDVPKYLAKIIDGRIEARLAWEHQREARMVRVDLSQLEGIRAAASVTREALLVDEEREDAPPRPPHPRRQPSQRIRRRSRSRAATGRRNQRARGLYRARPQRAEQCARPYG